jgi:hypothetical protein
MERDEANGAPATEVAAVVRRVLESPHPPRRVSAGKASERVGLLAKRALPFRRSPKRPPAPSPAS